MEGIRYVYTFGMQQADIEARLANNENGVLSLANDGAAYALPISYIYEDGQLFLRLTHHPNSKKMSYLETTTEACFLLYGYEDDDSSWSVVATGELRDVPEFDLETFNERFPSVRVFDEPIDDIELDVWVLDVEEITGRVT